MMRSVLVSEYQADRMADDYASAVEQYNQVLEEQYGGYDDEYYDDDYYYYDDYYQL